MPKHLIEIDLSDEEDQQLIVEAQKAGVSAAILADRWVKERLLHEREKALGRSTHGGKSGQAG